MRVEQVGEGEPELAVIGAIHGDEPCGSSAIERFLRDPPELERPVKFIIANERALEQDVRYTDSDLNRVFPGAPDAEEHESRLAHQLLTEVEGCISFSMHSTQSYPEPFAVINEGDPVAEGIVPYLGVDAAVDAGAFTEGRLIDFADVIEVECGLQRSDQAAENAYHLLRAFLGAVGALPDARLEGREVKVFRLTRLIPKRPAERYDVFVENFERVSPGATFAIADDDALVAEEPFYPVLMSPYGYENEFGYAAELTGTLG